MNIDDRCAERIINGYLTGDALIICDKPHINLANSIERIYERKPRNIKCLIIDGKESTDQAFNQCLENNIETLVFIEPSSFSHYQASKWLDFSSGMPRILNLRPASYVSVLPLDSTYRVYSSNKLRDDNIKRSLLSTLKASTNYKITTENGTELHFTSRKWIDLGNEVLTAPIEESVDGVIAVDGALFFQKIDTTIDFHIRMGRIEKIEARHKEYSGLVSLYNQMTSNDFKTEKNKQLAEIGIGCNTGAIISNCFMESEMVYGTCHFCFGNNDCYGGKNKSVFHGASILIKGPHFQEC